MNSSLIPANRFLLDYYSVASNRTDTNSSFPSPYTAQWNTMTVIKLILTLTSLFPNAALLSLFLTQKDLRKSSFNIYLTNLLICNVLYESLQKPADILNGLYPKAWPFGSAYCTFFIYLSWLLESGMRSAHGLITLNRLWAVLWPNSYRIRHSHRTAVISVLVSWIYLHAIQLPGIILEALYYRLPLGTHPCWTYPAAQPIWATTASILAFDVFHVIIIFAFPVIYYTRRQYMTSKINDMAAVNGRDRQLPETKPDGGIENDAHKPSIRTSKTELEKPDGEESHGGHRRARPRLNNRSFHVLTALTASVTVCWTPTTVYYTLMSAAPHTYTPPLLERVILTMLSLQNTLDPLLFVAILPDVRRAIIRLLKISE